MISFVKFLKGKNLPSYSRKWIEEIEKNLVFNNLISEIYETNEFNEQLYADIKLSQLNEDYTKCCQSETNDLLVSKMRKLNEFVSNSIRNDKSLLINNETFLKSINVVDLVTCNSTRTNCFTKKFKNFSFVFYLNSN